MRYAPEIAPEIRGLLEELVADPRSSIRLVPRRPLRYWFDSDETIRPREISGTKLERHLVEVHREELAGLFLAAAKIAYWKAPMFAHRPRDPEGRPFTADEAETRWRSSASTATGLAGFGGVELFNSCLKGVRAQDAFALARAALSTVPGDEARLYVGITVPWSQPRSSLQLLSCLESRGSRAEGPNAMRHAAARLCSLDRLHEARQKYVLALRNDPETWVGHLYAFNLSCCLGDRVGAEGDASSMKGWDASKGVVLGETLAILREWFAEREALKARAMQTAASIRNSLSHPFVTICEAYSS